MASEELRLAAAYNALGLVCKDLGRFDEARSAYARALAEIDKSPTAQPQAAAAIYHNLGGSRHPDFAAALNNLAVVCRRRGIPGQAESLYLEALDVLREVAPYGHPRATSIRRNLERCAGPREGNSNVLRESELEIHEPESGIHARFTLAVHPLAVRVRRTRRAISGDRQWLDPRINTFERAIPWKTRKIGSASS